MTSATVSRLHVAMYPTIRGFEDPMLETIARCYYDQHSPIIRPDDVQPAEIVERRVHVGVHNGLGFIGTVFSTTLEPVLDDEIGDGFELEFNGHLELANLCVDEPGLAVVFVLEYKVAIETCESKVLNKGGIGGIIERINGSGVVALENTSVERDVCVGWGFWSPSNGFGNTVLSIPLMFDTINPNTNGNFVYYPPSFYDGDVEEDGGDAMDEFGRPVASRVNPVILSFEFLPDGVQSTRSMFSVTHNIRFTGPTDTYFFACNLLRTTIRNPNAVSRAAEIRGSSAFTNRSDQ
jgi:hypothetical protein